MEAIYEETNENGVIYAKVEGVLYGLSPEGTLIEHDTDFNPSNCDCVDSESVAHYESVRAAIEALNFQLMAVGMAVSEDELARVNEQLDIIVKEQSMSPADIDGMNDEKAREVHVLACQRAGVSHAGYCVGI